MKFQSIYWENNAFCCQLNYLVIEQFSNHILPPQKQIDWKPLICSVAQINIYLLSFITELNFGVASNTHTHARAYISTPVQRMCVQTNETPLERGNRKSQRWSLITCVSICVNMCTHEADYTYVIDTEKKNQTEYPV